MENKKAKTLAQQLLGSEFESANREPANYCQSMGWHKYSKGTQKAISKKGSLAATAQDVENLTSIIESIGSEDIIEAMENNSVSDFLCNCVAGHIQA